jgi:hypothetical protein
LVILDGESREKTVRKGRKGRKDEKRWRGESGRGKESSAE